RLITDAKSFTYSRYTPFLYLKESITDFEKTQQKNLMRFMKTLLIKRLESSFYAFNKTLDRFILSYEGYLKAFRKGFVYISKKHFGKVMEYLMNDDFEAIERLIENEQAEQYKASDFTPDFKKHLESDLKTLHQIKSLWVKVKKDPKLDKFVDALKTDKVLSKNKIILFTESKETAEYLAEKLEDKLKEKPLLYHGSSGAAELKIVISNFDNKAKNKAKDHRILITTEVLSEGVNLHQSNVVINYDIPWNPTRMIQRVGRINRVDTPHKKIYTYNFFPTQQSNDMIKLEEAAIAKIEYFINMLGNDAPLLTDGEEIKSFELFNKLTSKEFITGEEDEQDSELKFLKVITDIRDNNTDLFEQIKYLPKKSRTSKKMQPEMKMEENSLVTYFRKGKLEKFCIANPESATEIDFITTAKLFESKPDTPKEKLLSNFYDLLEKNKTELEHNLLEVEEQQVETKVGSRDNANRILKILRAKEIRLYKGFTEEAEQYIKQVIKILDEGSLSKNLTKRVYNELKDQTQPLKILGVLKKNISDDYFKGTSTVKDEAKKSPKEVILSECFIKA
ncbi:MAG: helicase-related protein, partial [Bacteroidota bacterium]